MLPTSTMYLGHADRMLSGSSVYLPAILSKALSEDAQALGRVSLKARSFD